MTRGFFPGRAMAPAALLLVLAAPLAGQSVLLVQHGDKVLPVVSASGAIPYVEVSGHRVRAAGHRFGLQQVDEYLPVFISVRDLKAASSHLSIVGTGADINHNFEFSAEFESPYMLEDVFLVLDMDMEEAGKLLFIWEVGTLVPHHPKPISLRVPLMHPLGAGKFQFHIFVGGHEVLHSELPFTYREHVLDQMVAKRIAGVKDATPKPFIGPAPDYPEKLKKSKTEGKAVVSIRLSTRGSVLDPVVKEASDPAFGQAALVAVRQWRFLPRVKDGRPVEVMVDMPFVFSPPTGADRR